MGIKGEVIDGEECERREDEEDNVVKRGYVTC